MCDIAALEALKQSIVTRDAREIYHEHLMGHNLWLFEKRMKLPNAPRRYDELKGYVSQKLGLSFNNVAIIGSAKTDFSFNPSNDFSLFSDSSDIDFALVSTRHFYRFWDAYTEVARKNYLPNYNRITGSIFRKFVEISERHPIHHPHFEEWHKQVGSFKKDIQTGFGIIHDINYRIYDSWEAVETYHTDGINELKKKLSD